jgi:hypothetical protein
MKKIYIAPFIEIIILDNEISLSLESNPPAGPNEIAFINSAINNNPFKQQEV